MIKYPFLTPDNIKVPAPLQLEVMRGSRIRRLQSHGHQQNDASMKNFKNLPTHYQLARMLCSFFLAQTAFNKQSNASCSQEKHSPKHFKFQRVLTPPPGGLTMTIHSDEGLMFEKPALQSLYSDQFTFSFQLC